MAALLERVESGRRRAPRRVMLFGVHGIGKAQPLDAKVLTPTGFVEIGDLRVGDEVIGSDGKSHRVIGVYPQGEKEVFRVTFRDGSSTRCCDDHLWFTQTCNERRQGLDGAVRPLRDVRRTLRYGTRFNHGVPRVEPVQFAPQEDRLPLDPWLLGMYLGDGHMGCSVAISNPEPDVRRRIADSVAEGGACVAASATAVRIKTERPTPGPSATKQILRELGLEGLTAEKKFVPPPYLHASVEERTQVLRGLMDSDGHVTNPGAVEYSTASPQLADDVCFLIRSLGGSAKQVTKKPSYTYRGEKRRGKLAYRIFASFPPDTVPVSSEKHTEKWERPRWAIRHTIRNVESVGRMPCRCIRVDAPDALYVTDDFLLTHNSSWAAMSPKPIFIQTEDGLGEIDCARFPLAEDYDQVIRALSELYSEEHDYGTVVIDTLDWLERLIWAEVCRKRGVENIEDIGYAKGYVFALTQWREVLDGLQALRNDRDMMVVLVAHCQIEKFQSPMADTYDRYVPRLHKHASAVVQEWCDEVLFASYRVSTKQVDEGFDRTRTRAVGEAERVVYTTEGPAHVAKHRIPQLPDELPLDYRAYAEYLPDGAGRTQEEEGD